MTDNQQRAAEVYEFITYDHDPVATIARALDAAEARGRDRAADETERLADERVWVTGHDNEVVSARDLYEHVARLRGELEPVTYDFPPETE